MTGNVGARTGWLPLEPDPQLNLPGRQR